MTGQSPRPCYSIGERFLRTVLLLPLMVAALVVPAVASAQTAGSRVVATALSPGTVRAESLADQAAITEVIHAFALFYDTASWTDFDALLADDIDLLFRSNGEYGTMAATGRKAVMSLMSTARSRNDVTGELPYHMATGVVFNRLTATEARVFSYMTVGFQANGKATIKMLEHYDVSLIKIGNSWKIAKVRSYAGIHPVDKW